MPSVSRARVAAAVRQLKSLHKVGLKSLEQRGGRGGHGERRAEVEATRLKKAMPAGSKISGEIVRKVRQFADAESGYSRSDLDELCRLCREHGRAWGIKHLVIIIRVPKADGQRGEVQRRAIEGGWTTAQLEAEVRRRFGRRRAGGRKPAVMPDVEGLLSQLEGMCERWSRLHAELTDQDQPGASHPGLRDLPKAVRQKLGDATEALRQLQLAVDRQLKKRRRSALSGRIQ
jgi:hypothetical protein